MPLIARRVLSLWCLLAFQFVASAAAQSDANVTWANVVNGAVIGTVLQKTMGCDGCQDGGAASQEQLSADGYVEFTVGELNTLWMAGLSHGSHDSTYSDIDFGFRFNGAGYADVLEDGLYAGGDTTYTAGDVFRVAVVDGRVQYSKNGHYLRESARSPQFPLLLDTSLLSVGATVRNARLAVTAAPFGGGFTEKAGSPALRSRFTQSQIATFLPANGAKGKFTFPAPYNTDAVRLTNASDCAGGTDCLWYVGYSYWRNINNHVASNDMYIFVATDTNRGGVGPSLIRYNKVTDQVQNLDALFAANSPYHWSTGEGWYFSGTQATKLYTYLVGGSQLRRYDILSRQFDPTPAIDLNACPRPTICPSNAAFLTQPHSSDDDQVHSATLQNTDWQRIGCVVYGPAGFRYYPTPSGYSFDECHVDKSGGWLILLQGRPDGVRIDRVVDLQTGSETIVDAPAGALGHLDMGFGYAVGADSYNPLPNATILLKFPLTSTQRPIGPAVHYNKRWDLAAANHISHGNAIAGAPPESQYACGSNAGRTAEMADEIVCFSLNPGRNLDGSLDVLIVGQVMTDVDAPGGGPGEYEKRPKGNLDVTGRYFVWTTNLGGGRLDAFIVKVPTARLSPP